MVKTNYIEKSGTGIEKSGTGVEKSSTKLKRLLAIPVVLTAFLLWGPLALAIQNGGTGTASAGETTSAPDLAVNGELVTVSFREGYKVVSGYGYTTGGYAEISLYSLEYVHATDSEIILSETAPIQNGGTGDHTSEEGGNQQLKAWGIAEVVLSERGIADLIVYQFNGEGTLEEVGVYSGVEVH